MLGVGTCRCTPPLTVTPGLTPLISPGKSVRVSAELRRSVLQNAPNELKRTPSFLEPLPVDEADARTEP